MRQPTPTDVRTLRAVIQRQSQRYLQHQDLAQTDDLAAAEETRMSLYEAADADLDLIVPILMLLLEPSDD